MVEHAHVAMRSRRRFIQRITFVFYLLFPVFSQCYKSKQPHMTTNVIRCVPILRAHSSRRARIEQWADHLSICFGKNLHDFVWSRRPMFSAVVVEAPVGR